MILRTVLIAIFLWQTAIVSYAANVAPRISDREIIESLAGLKEGIISLEKNMDQRFQSVDQRFQSMDQRFQSMEKDMAQRFEAIDQRFQTLEKSMDQRFRSMESNFNKRFSFLENLILVVIASIIGLIGFVIWDRKTALRPLERKLDRVEQELQLQNSDGSRLDRLIRSMRELAKQDDKVAKALKAFSLL